MTGVLINETAQLQWLPTSGSLRSWFNVLFMQVRFKKGNTMSNTANNLHQPKLCQISHCGIFSPMFLHFVSQFKKMVSKSLFIGFTVYIKSIQQWFIQTANQLYLKSCPESFPWVFFLLFFWKMVSIINLSLNSSELFRLPEFRLQTPTEKNHQQAKMSINSVYEWLEIHLSVHLLSLKKAVEHDYSKSQLVFKVVSMVTNLSGNLLPHEFNEIISTQIFFHPLHLKPLTYLWTLRVLRRFRCHGPG